MSAIPEEIKHADLIVALEPLLEMLGVTAKDIFGAPGLTITATEVTFLVSAGEETGAGRRKRVRPADVGLTAPRDEACDELAVFVRVRTDLADDSYASVAARRAAAEGDVA